MQRDELSAIGELTGDALAGIAGQVHGIHDGIARRVWDGMGPLSTPVRLVHDVIAGGVYGGVERSLRVVPRTGARALAIGVRADARSLQSSVTGRVAIGVLNGAVGDTLERRNNVLALGTTLRCDGREVALDADALRAAFPHATGRLAVFVHGLAETDDAWRRGSDRHAPYGTRLNREFGYTPLYVRYNTGRSVVASGEELARLLAAVCAEWPVAVDEVALIGHAMGGLVARSACDHGEGSAWRARVGHVLTLGSPDRGAPLERAAGAIGSAMARMPETRTLAAALGRRSAGLKELRSGSRAVPFPADVQHSFVDYRRFGPIRHLRLLNDPEVYEQLRTRIAAGSGLPRPRRELPEGPEAP